MSRGFQQKHNHTLEATLWATPLRECWCELSTGDYVVGPEFRADYGGDGW